MVPLACLAFAAGATAVTGATVLLSSPGARGEPAHATAGSGGRSPGPARVLPAKPAGAVAPLRRVVPPDAMAIAHGAIERTALRRISHIRGVREVTSFDGGSIVLRGQRADVLGVRPSTFRAWTPPRTATEDALWTALANDEFVVSFGARRARGLETGSMYQFEGRESPSVRLGAVAALGLPGVDALVSESTSERLGLVEDLGVLVNAPGADMDRLTRALRAALGRKAQVISLRDEKAGPSSAGNAARGKPTSYLALYRQAAARCPGLSWTVLAAIGQIESGHGRNNGPSSAGALGPMQFMPATWARYGLDGDGDGRAEIMNPYDAVPSAAGYLCARGGGHGGASLSQAIWDYNHADWYVQEVLSLSQAYARDYG